MQVALVPPVSVDHIAQAAVSASLGLVNGLSYDGTDEINVAAKALGRF